MSEAQSQTLALASAGARRIWLSEERVVGLLLLVWWLVQMIQPLTQPAVEVAKQVGRVQVDTTSAAVESGSMLNTLLVVGWALNDWFDRKPTCVRANRISKLRSASRASAKRRLKRTNVIQRTR